MLLSSPKEEYVVHIENALRALERIYPVFEPTIKRVLKSSNANFVILNDAFRRMIIFHDLGKLTKEWQRIAEKEQKENRKLHKPAHAPIGAAYLYKILPEDLKEPISFAVAIHHSDKGLLGDNIEKPDSRAIRDGIVDYEADNIVWDEDTEKLLDKYFPEDAKELSLNDLTVMARGLRRWARGVGVMEEHNRRIQASLVHHILKLCDISAASEREEYKEIEDPFGGWLMVEKINKYVKNMEKRRKDE